MIKTFFNLFFVVVLVLGSAFLYGAFKNIDSLRDDVPTDQSESEVISEEKDGYIRTTIEDWVDYKNEDYGFLIQYPEDWEVQESLKPQNPKALHEIDLHQKESEMTRAYVTIQIFENPEKEEVSVWWDKWLGEEDQKEVECQEEHQGEAPCLFLRGMVEKETDSVLYDLSMKTIQLFQFDSSKECNYIAYEKYIYGVCYDGVNPNDPNFEVNKKTTSEIFSTFIFNDLIKEEVAGESFKKYVAGNWKSTDDSKNLMVLKEDPNALHGQGGVIENIYDGKKMDSGTWIIDGYKLKTEIEGDEFEYTIVFAGSERLELTFLSGGNTLHFVRVDK